MIIDRSIRPFVVYGEDPVLTALQKISANKARIVFCVTEHGHLVGSISDGDVRRWIAAQADVDLTHPCAEVANTGCAATPPQQRRPRSSGCSAAPSTVQVGEGEVDWPVLARQLDALAPGVGFIPEIWQGHVNNGEGFWLALERLEQWF